VTSASRDWLLARRRTLFDLALVGAVRLLVSVVVLALGFEAVSDDDFARVSLAQRWAAAPALDPTGTSWLPAPFWLYGSALALAGRSLCVARATAVLLAVGSALLVYAAGRLLTERRAAATMGAVVASLFPYGAILGAAPVPELPTAALTVFAIATVARPRCRWRLLGALALFVACLSRYEPWLVAGGFALLSAWDGRRVKQGRALAVVAAAVALLGPAAWLVHNRIAHGDALHFLRRVSAYRQALGHDTTSDYLGALVTHPLALVQKEPELALAVGLLSTAWLVASRSRGAAGSAGPVAERAARAPLHRPLGLVLWLVLGLSLAAARGGAATHHPERALLTVWLLGSVGAGAAIVSLGSSARPRSWLPLALGLLAAVVLGAAILRPWFARLDSFAHRPDEVAIGAVASERLPADGRVLLEVRDYAYFAVLAGSGRPEAFTLDRDLDPRRALEPSSFGALERLCARAQSVGARFAVGLREPGSPLSSSLPAPLAERGAWALWDLGDACELR
jgi:hypothetical protein